MKRIFLVCSLALVLTSCDSTAVSDESSSSSLSQFVVGDAWVLERTDTFEHQEPQISIDTLRVTEETKVNEESWYQLRSNYGFSFSGPNPESEWFSVRKDGLWKRLKVEGQFEAPWKLLPYPSQVGEEFQTESGLSIVRVAESELTTLSNGLQLEATPYLVRSSSNYRPLHRAIGDMAAYSDSKLSEEVQFNYAISSEYGFVTLQGKWISLGGGEGQLRVVGSFNLELLEFIHSGE